MGRNFTSRITLSAAALAIGAVGLAGAADAASKARGHQFGHSAFSARGGFGFAGMNGGFGGPGGALGFRGGMGGHGDHGPGGPGGAGPVGGIALQSAATYLGISLSTLTADLNSGKSLAEEAVAKGKTAAGLISAIVADAKSNLDAQVAAGWLTSAQETKLVDALTTQVTNLVNNGPEGHGPGSGALSQASLLGSAATYLGVTVSDLRTALESGKSLATVATDKGKTPSGLITALTTAAKAKLDAAVTAGTLTQAQEDSIVASLNDRITSFVNATPKAGGLHGPAFLDTAATYLGLTQSELKTALDGGKTLAQVATDKGKTSAGLISAIAAAAKANLDTAVAAGRLTQTEEDTLITNLTSRVTAFVNGTAPSHGTSIAKLFRR